MNNKFKLATAVVALLMVAAIVVTFEACKKEKINFKTQVSDVSNDAFAIFNSYSGVMKYNFELDNLNAKFNNYVSKSDSTDRFIIESIDILDDMPNDARVYPEVKIVVIDTYEEISYSMWLLETFCSKQPGDTNTYYYIDNDIEMGVYEFSYYDESDMLHVCNVNDNVFSDTIVDTMSYAPFRPKWVFTCRSHNCAVGECEKVPTGLGNHHYTCSPCNNPNAYCDRVGILRAILEFLANLL